ncbi:MAG: 1-aminocyclopropane-1-carboxylate deaminase/D-cysteine desulfhydrase [Stackebrandtia sp.]
MGQLPLTAGLEPRIPSPLRELDDARLADRGLRLLLKRDDLIHPDLPGNKWRKLKYNLEAAVAQGSRTLLTFGGAYSNHVRAVAAAGKLLGFSTIGVIRGEERLPLNPSLRFAADQGMRLAYMDRTTYRAKHTADVVDGLRRRFGDFYLLPEGGSNALAVAGCTEIPAEIEPRFDVLCCACGTGGTLAGVAGGLRRRQRAVGFSALKGGGFLADDVARLQTDGLGRGTDNWEIDVDFSFGGFAKTTPDLDAFVDDFERRHGLRLDRVYVAKMMYGVFRRAEQGRFAPGSVVVALITG